MNSDDDDNSKVDIAALYESLNPAKRALLPLEYQAILKLKGIDTANHPSKKNPQLSKIGRPPSGDKRLNNLSGNTTTKGKLNQIDHNPTFHIRNTSNNGVKKLKKDFVPGEVSTDDTSNQSTRHFD